MFSKTFLHVLLLANLSTAPSSCLQVGVLVDDFNFNATLANAIFKMAVDDGGKVQVEQFRSSGKIQSISMEPVFFNYNDLYKLYLPEERGGIISTVDVLVEAAQCKVVHAPECEELEQMADDRRDLKILTTCCSPGPIYEEKMLRNIVYNSIKSDEIAIFMETLFEKFGWHQFLFFMTPELGSVTRLYDGILRSIRRRNKIEDKHSHHPSHPGEMHIDRVFFSVDMIERYHLKYNLTHLINIHPDIYFLMLEQSKDLNTFLKMFNDNEKQLRKDGTAIIIIQWSSFAPRLVESLENVPNGLMLLRRKEPRPVDVVFNTQSIFGRDPEHVIYEQVRTLSAALRHSEREILELCGASFLQGNDSIVEYDEFCQRHDSNFEIVNFRRNEDKLEGKHVIDFFPYKNHNDDRLIILEQPFWPGSGWKMPQFPIDCHDHVCSNINDSKGSVVVTAVASTSAIAFVIALVVILFFLCRRVKENREEKISIKDLVIAQYSELQFLNDQNALPRNESENELKERHSATRHLGTAMNAVNFLTSAIGGGPGHRQYATTFYADKLERAVFRKEKVFVLKTNALHCNIDDGIVDELVKLRQLEHENINSLLAITVDTNKIVTIQPYCSKNTLSEVLFERKLQLDKVFKMSFARDIAAGLSFLHSSVIGSHGRLSSDNILVDSKWFCKIANIPLPKFENACMFAQPEEVSLDDNGTSDGGDEVKSILDLVDPDQWNDHESNEETEETLISFPSTVNLATAPELLREQFPPPRGTKKGDVYSYGVIIVEIISRKRSFSSYTDMTRDQILTRVAEGKFPPFRPKIFCVPGIHRLHEVALICMDEISAFRPDACNIMGMLIKANEGQEANLVDTMVATMENYAARLEHMVHDRTADLDIERKRSEELLSKMLPRSVMEELKANRIVNPEFFESVTISFLDVVGFTKMASDCSPIDIVTFLNDMYTVFDTFIDSYDVYKVETIGDSYMVASGLPQRNGNAHAGEIATMALEIMSSVVEFKIKHLPGKKLQLRCGMHSGSVVAGIIGLKMPRYCLFGDTVNYASRMESSCFALRIQVSSECKAILDILGGYHLEERGLVSIKGKGQVLAYYLIGKDGFNKPMPDLAWQASYEEHSFK